MKIDWNDSELTASTAILESNQQNKSEFTFENSTAEEETFFQSVPTDREIFESASSHLYITEDTIGEVPKKKISTEKKSSKVTKSVRPIKIRNGTESLPVKMESLTISQNEGTIKNSKNNACSIVVNEFIKKEREGVASSGSGPNLTGKTSVVNCDVNTKLSHPNLISKDKEPPKTKRKGRTPAKIKSKEAEINTEGSDQNLPIEVKPKGKKTTNNKVTSEAKQIIPKEKKVIKNKQENNGGQKPLSEVKQKNSNEKNTTKSVAVNDKQKPTNEVKQRKPTEKKVIKSKPENEEKKSTKELTQTKPTETRKNKTVKEGQKSVNQVKQVKPKQNNEIENKPPTKDKKKSKQVKQVKPNEKKVLNNTATKIKSPKEEYNKNKLVLNEISVIPDKNDKIVSDRAPLSTNLDVNYLSNYNVPLKDIKHTSNSNLHKLNGLNKTDDSNQFKSNSPSSQPSPKVTNSSCNSIQRNKKEECKSKCRHNFHRIKYKETKPGSYSSAEDSSSTGSSSSYEDTSSTDDYSSDEDNSSTGSTSSDEDNSSTGDSYSSEDDSLTGSDSGSSCDCGHCRGGCFNSSSSDALIFSSSDSSANTFGSESDIDSD